MAKVKKAKQPPELYWNDFVSIFFSFTKEKFNETPSFDGSQPRDLKNIIIELRKRCEKGKHEWTYEAATTRFRHFLEYCFLDRWLSNNWILRNLNSQKDRIFFEMARKYQNLAR